MLNLERPDVINPPAIVVQAFDEKKALAEIKAAVELRDESKAGYKDAILQIGSWLTAARRAMPGTKVGGSERYSPGFLNFVASTGLTPDTARNYMGYVRDPSRLEAKRKLDSDRMARVSRVRRKTLAEIVKALDNGFTPDEVIAAIRKEINESK